MAKKQNKDEVILCSQCGEIMKVESSRYIGKMYSNWYQCDNCDNPSYTIEAWVDDKAV